MFLAIALFSISSICLIASVVFPWADDKRLAWQDEKEKTIGRKMDDMFYYDRSPRQIVLLYYMLPPILATLSYYLVSKSLLVIFFAAGLGVAIPNIILKVRDANRRRKFRQQILDCLMLLSSCLKGGLSLLQSFEVIVEEMPAPMAQEMGLLVRENKMGVTLEEALKRFDRRIQTEEWSLVINSILVARETGGDLTKVFSRLCTTIRDNQKLKDSIQTLTLQGRLQGIIMSALPFLFVAWVLQFNKNHFDVMWQNDLGRMLMIAAILLQIVGMVLIRKFSIIKI
ncbi:MAG: hypothetical protein C4533_08160 [Candidatus Omnitrophota bacterium]|jgi:tight adherence protein B|nr:MAG: hypothetical protein C4533_08160 [Candidatus Omnitrophota bacterium]